MTRPLVWVAVASAVGVVLLAAIVAGVAGSAPSSVTAGYGASRYASKSIPPEALALYQAAAADQGMDWAILAGIGKVETNHCRSKLPGVHSGTNSAGAAGCMQFLAGTWAIYGKGGSPYDLADAIPAAARLLKAAGAPGDYHRAIFAYNHLESYVQEVMRWADRYRGGATGSGLGGDGEASTIDPGAQWLMPVPGTGVVCDRRIVADVTWIIKTYHAIPTDCYAPTGHKPGGEHPLGLGIDLVPGSGGSWDLLDKLAHDLGWRESCAATGCAEQKFLRPFRFVGWNGFPGHGDPAHCPAPGCAAHLHLSWAHSGGRPATTVYTLR